MMGNLTLPCVIVVIAAYFAPAAAQERIVPIVASGEWVAEMYQPSMTAPPTKCFVYNGVSGFILRADDGLFEMRVSDRRWSLPFRVSGAIVVKVGNFTLNEQIFANTSNTVSVVLDDADLLRLLSEMDKAGAMTVTVGNAGPFQVSLAGSTRATNAFRTCARLPGADAGPGSNPFR